MVSIKLSLTYPKGAPPLPFNPEQSARQFLLQYHQQGFLADLLNTAMNANNWPVALIYLPGSTLELNFEVEQWPMAMKTNARLSSFSPGQSKFLRR